MTKIRKIKNYGFKAPVITIDQHIFGAKSYGQVVNPSGQWDDSLPTYEAQADKFETQGCTVWGSQNAIETLHKFNFKEDKNFEELFTYIDSGINPMAGGDPHAVAESIRHNGLVESPNYPFPTTLNDLLNLLGNPQPSNVTNLAKKYLDSYKFNHVWVLQGHEEKEQRIADIKDALKYGVLGVSVSAWNQQNDIYVDGGMRNNHWCVCYGWTDKGWKIFDSYDQSTKIYDFNSEITFAKLYFIQKGNFSTKTSWAFIDIIKKFISSLFKK